MKLKLDEEDVYDALTMEWLYAIAAIIKPHLLASGLTADQAEDVGGDILFDLGMLHDQGKIKDDEGSDKSGEFIPRIAFVDEAGDLITTGEDSGLHEYAFGANSSAYEAGS